MNIRQFSNRIPKRRFPDIFILTNYPAKKFALVQLHDNRNGCLRIHQIILNRGYLYLSTNLPQTWNRNRDKEIPLAGTDTAMPGT